MGKSSGCVLILAGLAVGAYALHDSQPQAGPEVAAAQSGPSGGEDGPSAALTVADKPANTGASPAPQPAPEPASEPSKSGKSEKSGTPGVVPPTPLVPPAPVPAKRPRTAVATVEVGAVPLRVPVGESKAVPPPLDGVELTSEIQRHLKRIGCYRGEVTGVWSSAVRQAMRTVTEGANASLPVDEPDPVLLAMVKSQAPGACGTACPRGQDRVADGRCMPRALIEAGATAKGSAKTAMASGEAAKKRPRADPVVAGAPQAKASRPQAGPRPSSKVAGWSSRSAKGRPRMRRAQRPSYTGYSSVPSWALPFLLP
jgi:hypothetical protein